MFGARLGPDSQSVLVLDVSPPLVRVYHGGTLEHAFLKRGGGPGESGIPAALAVSRDSQVLVADVAGRISFFSLRGEHLGSVNDLPFRTLAAAQCGPDWVLYGPSMDAGRRVGWLHLLQVTRTQRGLSGRTRTLFSDSGMPESIPIGKPVGLVADDAGALALRHDLTREPVIVVVSCRPGEPVAARVARRLEGAPPAPSTRVLDRAVAVVTGNAGRASAGVANLRSGLLLADMEFRITGRFEGFTRFTLISPRRTVRVSVPGVYMIRDSRPGLGVLFSSSDPVPHVFVVHEDSLLAALRGPGGRGP
ncbi:MAG: hypothetical protein AAB409_00450 [Gemmatimonadota bacterium]